MKDERPYLHYYKSLTLNDVSSQCQVNYRQMVKNVHPPPPENFITAGKPS